MTHLEGLNAGILWLIKPVRDWYVQVESSVFNCSGMSENYTFFEYDSLSMTIYSYIFSTMDAGVHKFWQVRLI